VRYERQISSKCDNSSSQAESEGEVVAPKHVGVHLALCILLVEKAPDSNDVCNKHNSEHDLDCAHNRETSEDKHKYRFARLGMFNQDFILKHRNGGTKCNSVCNNGAKQNPEAKV
jgi:hypothetical protein